MIMNNLYTCRCCGSYMILCHSLFFVALSKLMQSKFGETALITASYYGHLECATVLLKYRADVNYQRKVRPLRVHG